AIDQQAPKLGRNAIKRLPDQGAKLVLLEPRGKALRVGMRLEVQRVSIDRSLLPAASTCGVQAYRVEPRSERRIAAELRALLPRPLERCRCDVVGAIPVSDHAGDACEQPVVPLFVE